VSFEGDAMASLIRQKNDTFALHIIKETGYEVAKEILTVHES